MWCKKVIKLYLISESFIVRISVGSVNWNWIETKIMQIFVYS
jgi:hypothetical protein